MQGRGQFWYHVGYCFFDLLFIAFVYLVWRTLLLCLTVKCLCSAHKEINCPNLPGGSDSKESICKARDLGLILGLGRSPRERMTYPLQYSGLENSMDRGTCRATVHGVAKSQTWLSEFYFLHLWIDEINTPLPNAGWPLIWRCFARLKTLSLYFPTVSPSLFCLLTLVPHCFFLSDLLKNLTSRPQCVGCFEALASSFQSASSPIKVSFLPQYLVSWIHWPVVRWVEWAWTCLTHLLVISSYFGKLNILVSENILYQHYINDWLT